MCFFFFSSRRRHTRFKCDWSSDVCSSDLGMKVSSFSETFHSQYFCSTTLECQHETGKRGLAVQKNGASPAFSQFTAVLRARVTEIFAQYLQQGLVRREGDIGLFAVQSESYLCRFLRFRGQCGHDQAPLESIS